MGVAGLDTDCSIGNSLGMCAGVMCRGRVSIATVAMSARRVSTGRLTNSGKRNQAAREDASQSARIPSRDRRDVVVDVSVTNARPLMDGNT